MHGFSSFQEDKAGLDLAEGAQPSPTISCGRERATRTMKGPGRDPAEAIERTMGQLSEWSTYQGPGPGLSPRFLDLDDAGEVPAMSDMRTLRGKVAVAGVGETPYYRHGKSPVSEFKLALQAILAACEDADASIHAGSMASPPISNDRNDPSRLAAALGLPALRFSNMNWGGGGGGGAAAVGNAAAAVACGMANCVVVFRALAQGQFQRFGAAPPGGTASGENAFNAPYGVMSPAQRYAMRAMRFLHENKIAPSAQRAIALASYHHAQSNPRAVSSTSGLYSTMR